MRTIIVLLKRYVPSLGVGVCRLLGSGATRADNFAGSAPIWWSFDSGCTGRGKCFRPLDNPADPSCCKRPIDYGPAGSDCQDRRGTS